MSDTWIIFIPKDREYDPLLEARDRAVDLLSAFVPLADEVEANSSEEIRFIDCGGYWMGVTCPECGADAEPWFFNAVSKAYETSRFRDLSVVAPCCGSKGQLNQLKFGWPVGFARFVLKARNPGLDKTELERRQLQSLETTLGCSLLVIWRHL